MRLAPGAGRPVPHMGWNTLDIRRPCALLEGLADGDYAYFVHSYALDSRRGDGREHAITARPSAPACNGAISTARNSIPERSAAVGARLLQNFLAMH